MSCIILIFFISLLAWAKGEFSPIVNTNVGPISGLRRSEFTTYLGIPYGQVDERNPFGAAKPYPPFQIPFQAHDNPPVCPQVRLNGTIQGDIHCLHLNIYTPNDATADGTYPVMVYVHGGAFVEGNGNLETYSPKYLVRNDVIFVTVNYRLGPYGFLCLPELGYSNQGINDVVLALKWVKDNINSFGGDENNILLFGHSSGSVLVDFILLYNEDNVFNKVIMQSAQVVTPYVAGEPANEDHVLNIAEQLDIDVKDGNIENLMKELSSVDTSLVIEVTRDYVYRPCIDNELLTKTPKKRNMKEIKIMIGTTDKEILYFYRGDERNHLKQFEGDIANAFVDLPKDAVDIIKDFYITENIIDSTVDGGSDFVFNYAVERAARFYLDNNATVYRYLFPYDGGRNFMKIRDGVVASGAAHGDELGYIFDMDILGDKVAVEDQYVIDIMTYLWTNFAKFGNPTPESLNKTPLWRKYQEGSKYYMNIDSSVSVKRGVYQSRMAFWDMFYKMYGDRSRGFNLGEEYTNRREKDFIRDEL